MSDENTTPADLAQQAADKAQQAQHDTEQGNYTQAGEHLGEAQANEADEAVDLDALRKQLARYEAENRKLKDENGDRRVKAKQAEEQAATLKRKLAQVLGFEPSDEDPGKKSSRPSRQRRNARRSATRCRPNSTECARTTPYASWRRKTGQTPTCLCRISVV
ncbi:hypothetical protein [Corynebacterium sp. HMSC29G08]|uniref:hypothetical protein n=1 Tax=Corynebacterium sp. HMSC29G08 TaxID=1581069 RepID=UPI0008A4AA59|nr:hypothetical protein [Corynebacterium sp. HMSC29G08]OFT81259.1 hypothetical protein HMPREF3101_10525 [Corynebacterium sp. HMSC29G08]